MTQDRDFKKVVRTRMAKTGESYAAARAKLRPKYSFESLTPDAKRALARAEELAAKDARGYISTVHLLLGAMRNQRDRWKAMEPRSWRVQETPVEGDGLRPTREAQEALERAFQAARQTGERQVTREHLLLGIMAVPSSQGAFMLGADAFEYSMRYSPDIHQVLQLAGRRAKASGADEVTLEDLLAVLDSPASGAPPPGAGRARARRTPRSAPS